MISSFRSRDWWDANASTVSMKPSMWMPPVISRGRQAAAAANRTESTAKYSHSHCHSSSAAPQKMPTTGKQQMA